VAAAPCTPWPLRCRWSLRSPCTSIPRPSTHPRQLRYRTSGRLRPQAQDDGDLINACLHDEMRCDPRIVVFGEDVADASREEALNEVKARAASSSSRRLANRVRLRARLQTRRSPRPTSSAGRWVTLSAHEAGRRNSVLRLHLAGDAPDSQRAFRPALAIERRMGLPAVIRVPIGGYLTGGSIYHSQSGESIFTHIPACASSSPLRSRRQRPAAHRHPLRRPGALPGAQALYRETHDRAPYPGPDFAIPFGKARLVRAGADLTIITYGALVPRSLQAASAPARA